MTNVLTAMKNSHFNQVTVDLAISSLLSLLGIPSPLLFLSVPTALIPITTKHSLPAHSQFLLCSGAHLRPIQSSRSMAWWVTDVLVLANNHFGVLNHFWESDESRLFQETHTVLYRKLTDPWKAVCGIIS